MWKFEIIWLLAATTILAAPYPEQQKLSGSRRNGGSIIKRQALDEAFVNEPLEQQKNEDIYNLVEAYESNEEEKNDSDDRVEAYESNEEEKNDSDDRVEAYESKEEEKNDSDDRVEAYESKKEEKYGEEDLDEKKDDEDEDNKYIEEEKGTEGQGKEGSEEQNPGEIIVEVVKPPSFFESLFTWPPSFSWPPTISWPPSISWPSFELPTFSLPSFFGGRAQVAQPSDNYYHYANYPNNPNYRLVSYNDVYYTV